MNTVVSYLMAFALQLVALILPHQNEHISISVPYQYEKPSNVTPHSFTTNKEQELEDNC